MRLTSLESLLVREQETSKDHVFHEFRQNGGRGMSIIDEAFRLNIPKAVLEYFVNKALQNPTAGEFSVLLDSFSNY
jgi:hypothetical protein